MTSYECGTARHSNGASSAACSQASPGAPAEMSHDRRAMTTNVERDAQIPRPRLHRSFAAPQAGAGDGDHRRQGDLRLRRDRARVHRGGVGDVVHLARLRRGGADRSRRGADAQAPLLPHAGGQELEPGDLPRRAAGALGADRGRPRLPRAVGVGSQRLPDQVPLVLQQRVGAAAQEEGHHPAQQLPRRHRGGVEPDRHREEPPRLRRAAARVPAHARSALLPQRPSRRDPRAVRRSHRRRPRAADRRRGTRHRDGVHGRAGDRRRRRHHPARRLLAEGAGGARPPRRAASWPTR